MKYKKEYKIDMPQTIGETDSHFDLSNYCEWLENKYDKAIKELNEVHLPNASGSSFKPTDEQIEQIEQASEEYVEETYDEEVINQCGFHELVNARVTDFKGVLAKLKKIIGENVR